jgi:hypothetical protein
MSGMKPTITIIMRNMAGEVTWQWNVQHARAAMVELQKFFADNKNPDLS